MSKKDLPAIDKNNEWLLKIHQDTKFYMEKFNYNRSKVIATLKEKYGVSTRESVKIYDTVYGSRPLHEGLGSKVDKAYRQVDKVIEHVSKLIIEGGDTHLLKDFISLHKQLNECLTIGVATGGGATTEKTSITQNNLNIKSDSFDLAKIASRLSKKADETILDVESKLSEADQR